MSDLKPGREMDALVIKKVMTDWVFCESSFEQVEPSKWRCNGDIVWPRLTFSPSTDIAAAWEVVKVMNRKAVTWNFQMLFEDECCAQFYGGKPGISFLEWDAVEVYDTITEAICMAAIDVIPYESCTCYGLLSCSACVKMKESRQ